MAGTGERPLALEVAGLPGAGKTSIVADLTPVGSTLPRSAYLRAGLMPSLVLRAIALARLIPPMPSASRLRVLRWMLRVESMYRALTERREGEQVVVLDQGPVYTLVRLREALPARHGAGLARWWARQIALWSERLDLLVVLDAPDDVLVQRIGLRAKDHILKSIPKQDAARSLATQRQLWDSVIAELSARRPLPVVRLDTTRRPAEQLAQQIRSTVGEITAARSSAPVGPRRRARG